MAGGDSKQDGVQALDAPQLFKLSGPGFNAAPFPPLGAPGGPTGASVGTATFAFSSGNAANFIYTINGVTQVKPITREIFTPPGTVCEDVKAASAVKGLWVGKTSINESVLALITQDGTYYMLYSTPGSTTDAGVLQGFVRVSQREIRVIGRHDFPDRQRCRNRRWRYRPLRRTATTCHRAVCN